MSTLTSAGQPNESITHAPEPDAFDPNTGDELPRVAFPSIMSKGMTRDQEQVLMDHVIQRSRDVEMEMGRDQVLGDDWHSAGSSSGGGSQAAINAANTWMGRRCRWEAIFNNDVSWRPWVGPPDNIFWKSNLTVPLCRRITNQSIARAHAKFFGTDPWFNAHPHRMVPMDDDQAEKIERFLRFKLKQIETKPQLKRAVSKAYILGECVVKTTYVVRENIYQTMVNALIGADGQPILDAKGDPILQGAQWLDSGTPGVWVLAADGKTVKPEAELYQNVPITKRHVVFEGPEATPIYFKDAICPLTAKSWQTADFCAIISDRPVSDMVDIYEKRGVFLGTDAERYQMKLSAAAAVRAMLSNTPTAKSGASQPTLAGEQTQNAQGTNTPYGSNAAVAEIAECWLFFDVFGDNILRDVYMVYDRKSGFPLFYDYVENTTPDGTRPIDVVRIHENSDRWYGMGMVEQFSGIQEILDLIVNRQNLNQSSSGRVDFLRSDLLEEGAWTRDLQINWGGVMHAKKNAKVEEILKSVYLNDNKFGDLQAQIQFWQQWAVTESGTTAANDGQTAGLDSQKLAYGIKNIERNGDEMSAVALGEIEPCIQEILDRTLSVLLANLNDKETFRYFEKDVAMQRTITPEEVADVKFDVELVLSEESGEMEMAQMTKAAEIIERFYMLAPAIQVRVAETYRNMLRALNAEIEVDEAIQPIDPMTGQPMMTTGANGMPPAAPQMAPPASAPNPSAAPPANGQESAPAGMPSVAFAPTPQPVLGGPVQP